MPLTRLTESKTARVGLGLAAAGRPGYITTGRAADLPRDRSVDALRSRSLDLLDAAYERGVRYVDVARSYGRAEEFLADWLAVRAPRDVVVGSKWGYTYTAGWRVDAAVHEVKDHSLPTFERQLAETRRLLGTHLDLYQIHSVTPESPALTDARLQRRLADLRGEGVSIGVSVSGPAQPAAIRAALALRVDGRRLLDAVQATWNLLEPSAGPALAEAHAEGVTVIVKEALANGRLATPGAGAGALDRVAGERGLGRDSVAIAAALSQPWADIVLSGAVTPAQLTTNVDATRLALDPGTVDALLTLAEPADRYWAERSARPWT